MRAERLHEWMLGTRFWEAGGTARVDNAFAERHSPGIGAEIMGANKFGPPGWPDDPDWTGWWGEDPPFHTPTFVLTYPDIRLDLVERRTFEGGLQPLEYVPTVLDGPPGAT